MSSFWRVEELRCTSAIQYNTVCIVQVSLFYTGCFRKRSLWEKDGSSTVLYGMYCTVLEDSTCMCGVLLCGMRRESGGDPGKELERSKKIEL